MTRSALIDAVRVRIDEVSSGRTALVDVGVEENNPTDTMIDGLLDEAALEVLQTAPLLRLPVSDGKTATVTPDEDDNAIGEIALPANFLRMVCLQMSDWNRPLYHIEPEGSLVADRQKNVYLRGSASKPVAVLEKRPSGYVLCYFSTDAETPSVKRLDYVPALSAENITGQQNIDALCWVCAAKVLTITQDTNAAAAAMEHARSLLK